MLLRHRGRGSCVEAAVEEARERYGWVEGGKGRKRRIKREREEEAL